LIKLETLGVVAYFHSCLIVQNTPQFHCLSHRNVGLFLTTILNLSKLCEA